jgi:HAD superfamily hydrolase (TIGR01459 family)
MIVLPGVASLLPRYAAFLVDQFGTLHDGTALYPGAAAALRALRAAGRQVVLLSNSGKPAEANMRRLARLGIGPDDYDLLLTSGEVARRLLTTGAVAAARRARRCLLLERDGDGAVLDGTGLDLAAPAAADLVVIAGSEGERRTLAWYAELLAGPARRGVPALCLNPDRTMLTPQGLAFGAGRIAELYTELGGEVTWIGKPYPAIYEMALSTIRAACAADVAGIGDSVEHDIAGARAAGCAAWLVRTGIIAGWTDEAIAAECARYNAPPDGVLEAFA